MPFSKTMLLFILSAGIGTILASTPVPGSQIIDLLGMICTLVKDILPILTFLLFVLAAIMYGLNSFFDSETRAKMKKWGQDALTSAVIMLVLYVIGPMIIELALDKKFCTVCGCPSCPEGTQYNSEIKLCCTPGQEICCPVGQRVCSDFCPFAMNCPSGCCTDRCECLIPNPQDGTFVWTSCTSGNSDCNNDGTPDCNTSDISNVCFGGSCNLGSKLIPFGTCKEGWSDCDNDASTSSVNGGEGCECPTGGGEYTCCGGKCVSTCQNPSVCSSTDPCCAGYGCVNGECKLCDGFNCTDTATCDCPTGCGCPGANQQCATCSNPSTCNSISDCCCGYTCNPEKGACEWCDNPSTCDATHACCTGYGCLEGKCQPCENSKCTDTTACDCPAGCGCPGTNQNCDACVNPGICDSNSDCCCGYKCNDKQKCELISCPAETHWDGAQSCCVFDANPNLCIPSCPEGTEYNITKNMCCVIGDSTKCCPVGSSLNAEGRCCLISDPTKCCPMGTSWNSTRGCCVDPATDACVCDNPSSCDENNLCCIGYGCLSGKCQPCNDFKCTDTTNCDCPTGCGCPGINQNCNACQNPQACSMTNPCCCGYACTADGICIQIQAQACILLGICPSGYSDCDNAGSCECNTGDGSHFCFNNQCISSG